MSKSFGKAIDPTSQQVSQQVPERSRPNETGHVDMNGTTSDRSKGILPSNSEPSGFPTATDLKTSWDVIPRRDSGKSIATIKPSTSGKDSSRLTTASRDTRRQDEVGQSSKKSSPIIPPSFGRLSSPSDPTVRKNRFHHENGVGYMPDESKRLGPSTLEDSHRRSTKMRKATHASSQPITGRILPRDEITEHIPISKHLSTLNLPFRNSRRESLTTEDESPDYSSSVRSNTEASPSGFNRTSASHHSTRRTPSRTGHASYSDAQSRDDSAVCSMPPRDLEPATEDRSRSQPRAESIRSGGMDITSSEASVAAPETAASSKSRQSIRNNIMVNYLYQQAAQNLLLTPAEPWQGVVLKRTRGDYACCPPELIGIKDGLYQAVLKMNVRCAMTVDTHVTQTIIKSLAFGEIDYVPLPGGLQVQVIQKMADLHACQLHHFAAFVADLEVVVVWDDEPENLLARAEDLQAQFVKLIWVNDGDTIHSTGKSLVEHSDSGARDVKSVEPGQLEAACEPARRVKLNCAFINGFTLCLLVVCLGTGWRKLAMEIKTDGHWHRLALLAVVPIQVFASMFFFHALVGSICRMFGPINQLEENSKWYSGKAPTNRLQRDRDHMPHLTIQMPVYKEGLRNVIRPTILAVKAAISTYEMQGGTASIFVNDDGMQLIPAEDAYARREFYDEHKIGWVARPGHGSVARPGQKPFFRRGKFKKASNMNYCLNVSNRIEARLETISRSRAWTQEDEDAAYVDTLAAVLKKDQGRTWAGGNIRIGEHILLIDSDTRVPKDCLLSAMSEMEQSPEVAIIQFQSGVLNVTDSFFEKGVTWFTDMIYSAITWAVAGGDATPFVGHNAILRWSAIQTAAAYHEPEDNYEKYWSEDHVSEDFAMVLKTLAAGYVVRYASYTGVGFKEGVSLTVYDELARWEKYAYGVNEVIFHPFRKWITHSPFTPLFRSFITNKHIPLTHKLTICAYLGTYYAIASAFCITAMNYFLTGWEYGMYDKFYRDSFSTFLSTVTVFTLLGNLSLAAVRYRFKQGGLLENFWKNLIWVPFFTIFLGGVSLHLSQSILCHFFEIDMSWGATSKEVEDTVFGKEVVLILKKFKGTFFVCGLSIAVVVYLGCFAPYNWQIRHFSSIFPLAMLIVCHLALPLFLNPSLMRLSW